MSHPTRDELKARSKHLAKLLQEKYNLKVSHGHCLDIVSQLFGHKDWNTASAAAPSEESHKPDPGWQLTPWLEALTKGFHLSVEQPYKKETFHAGGAMAQRSIEEGVRSLPFTPRVDEAKQMVFLTLPLEHSESTNDAVIGMHKGLYLQREKDFAEKLGGKAEDFGRTNSKEGL